MSDITLQNDDNTNNETNSVKQTIQGLAEIMQNVMEVDIEVVDASKNRILGTGIYSDDMDIICGGVLYEKAFSTNQYVIIQNPRRNELCLQCPNNMRCLQKLDVAFPVYIGERIIGAIGLVCYSNEQKKRFIENGRSFMLLISQCAKLMGMSVLEHQEKTALLEKVGQGSSDIVQKSNSADDGDIRKLEDIEQEEIEKALNKYGHDTQGKKLAAAKLGIGIATLYRKVNKE